MKTFLIGLGLFLTAFLPAWVSEASAMAGSSAGLGWSILVAKSLIPGMATLTAYLMKSPREQQNQS